MILKITKRMKKLKEASPLSWTVIGGLKSIEVIHSEFGIWKEVAFDKKLVAYITIDHSPVLIFTVEFKNGIKEIYMVDTTTYLLNDNGKTVDTYYL